MLAMHVKTTDKESSDSGQNVTLFSCNTGDVTSRSARFIKRVLKKKNYHMNGHCSRVLTNKSVKMEQNNKHTYATATSVQVFLNHMHNTANVRKDRT